ncbi:MAG: hypothetical protein SW833_21310 [Cyanobacteriota bacterium]|nr:hypothetical protein [Cyanobacteriota bacterium]
MARRVQIDIEGLEEKITAFMKVERRSSLAQMIRVLVEEALEARGEPPILEEFPEEAATNFIKALARGKQPSLEEMAELARSLSLSEKELLAVCDRVLKEKE